MDFWEINKISAPRKIKEFGSHFGIGIRISLSDGILIYKRSCYKICDLLFIQPGGEIHLVKRNEKNKDTIL
jgi:hypothetical protein